MTLALAQKKQWVGYGFVKWRVMNTDTSDIFCQKYFNKKKLMRISVNNYL